MNFTMAKEEKVVLGALDITIQRHSSELYLSLIPYAARPRKPIKLNLYKRAVLLGGRSPTGAASRY